MAQKTYRSRRVERRENRRFLYQSLFILVATIGLFMALIFFGIPLLTKLAIVMGDLRSSNTPIEQKDVLPPAIPQLSTPPKATNSAYLDLYGFTEPGSTVHLYQNGSKTEEAVTSEEGKFDFIDIELEDEINTFYTLSIDAAGNNSAPSQSHTIFFDQTDPEIEITQPEDGHHYYGYNQQTISIVGKTEPGSQVKVNDKFLVINSQGEFNGRVQLSEGENKLKLTSTDMAGNQSEMEITVRYSQ